MLSVWFILMERCQKPILTKFLRILGLAAKDLGRLGARICSSPLGLTCMVAWTGFRDRLPSLEGQPQSRQACLLAGRLINTALYPSGRGKVSDTPMNPRTQTQVPPGARPTSRV